MLCFLWLFSILLIFPLGAEADSQVEYHALCQKAMQSGAAPTDMITGSDLSMLLERPLSDSEEPLTLSELCGLIRVYLHGEKLILPSLREGNPEGTENDDVLLCYEGGILSEWENTETPVPLGQACMILSRLMDYACAPDYDQPVSSLQEDNNAGVEVLENTLIMGHSNVVGLFLTMKSPLSYAARDGASTYDYLSLHDLILGWGVVGSASQALRVKRYSAVYIMLGTNDCMAYYAGLPAYHKQLAEIIELVQFFQPEAKLCPIGISPIGFSDIEVREELRPNVIRAYNREQKSLSRDYGIEYLDIYSLLADENGYNTRNITREDGLHYTVEGYECILREIYTHPLK